MGHKIYSWIINEPRKLSNHFSCFYVSLLLWMPINLSKKNFILKVFILGIMKLGWTPTALKNSRGRS